LRMRISVKMHHDIAGERRAEKFPIPDQTRALTVSDVVQLIYEFYIVEDWFPVDLSVDDLELLHIDGDVINPRSSPTAFQSSLKEDARFVLARKDLADTVHRPVAVHHPVTNHQTRVKAPPTDNTVVCRGCNERKSKDLFATRQLKKASKLCYECAAVAEEQRVADALEAPEFPSWIDQLPDPWGGEDYTEERWNDFEELALEVMDGPAEMDKLFVKTMRSIFLVRSYRTCWARWDDEALDGDWGYINGCAADDRSLDFYRAGILTKEVDFQLESMLDSDGSDGSYGSDCE